jgi:hypothetical protein
MGAPTKLSIQNNQKCRVLSNKVIHFRAHLFLNTLNIIRYKKVIYYKFGIIKKIVLNCCLSKKCLIFLQKNCLYFTYE